jgi:hypothetical protein
MTSVCGGSRLGDQSKRFLPIDLSANVKGLEPGQEKPTEASLSIRRSCPMADNGLEILTQVCSLLASGNARGAATTLQDGYPFQPIQAVERKYGAIQATQIFARDGFIDRYSGKRLIFPGTLRLISCCLPNEFPFHPNWKMTDTHPAYWELAPTVDHIVPIARGGADDEDDPHQLRNTEEPIDTDDLAKGSNGCCYCHPPSICVGVDGAYDRILTAYPEVTSQNRACGEAVPKDGIKPLSFALPVV